MSAETTPRAAELAAELGVALTAIRGTGKGGRVTVRDVRAADTAIDFDGLTTEQGVRRDLEELARRDPELARSGLAASALAMARTIDDSENTATSRTSAARALLDTMNRLWELAPGDEEADSLDQLSARRAARRAGGTAASP